MNVAEPAVAETRAAEVADVGAGTAKAKKIAEVTLTSFVVYRQHGRAGEPGSSIEVLAGASDARFDDKGRIQLLASSVPFRSEAFASRMPHVGAGLLALYGHRDALEELQFWRNFARSQKAEFAYVNYNVVVDNILPMLVDRDRLRASTDVRFLNVRRMMTSLQDSIFKRFQGYVASEGGAKATMTVVAEMANRPDLWDRLFDDDKDFKHLQVLVIPVADDPEVVGKMRQVAYVRPGATVTSVVQGNEQVDVLLPAWLTDEKVAKKLRKQSA
jgi:hypothetical protein